MPIPNSTKNYSKGEERRFKMDFDEFIEKNLQLSETQPVYCPQYQEGRCKGGCNLKHIKLSTAIVCKHWLKGLCKKNENCTFLHEFNLKKMPECFFFNVYGTCNNSECFYRHIEPDSSIKECPWYRRGFCKNGPSCKSKHVRKALCIDYANGFCIKGPDCKFAHPKDDTQIFVL
jgi:cleavage and polyadenylation specificity factor subunit 4